MNLPEDPVIPKNADLTPYTTELPTVIPNFTNNIINLGQQGDKSFEPRFTFNQFVYAMRVANGKGIFNDKLFQTHTMDSYTFRERFAREILTSHFPKEPQYFCEV